MELVVSDVGEKDFKLLLRIMESVNMADFLSEETEKRVEELKKKIQNAVFVEDEDYERFLYYFHLRKQENKRLKDIYFKLYEDKEFRELDDKHSTIVSNRLSCENKSEYLEAKSFKEIEADLNEKIKVVLKRLGFTPEDIKRHYVCNNCFDSGFIYGDMRCDCYKGRAVINDKRDKVK